MNLGPLEIPGGDAWILDRLARLITKRLVHAEGNVLERQSLVRLLFGVQRLPLQTPGLRLVVGSEGNYIEFTDEYFGVTCFTEDGHTEFRLHYFEGNNHCFYWNENLVKEEKRSTVELRIQDLEDAFSSEKCLSIEDYSVGPDVDVPPIGDYMEYSLSYAIDSSTS